MKKKAAAASILAVILILVFLPVGSLVYEKTISPINSYNTSYLEGAQADALKVMIPIMGARALADAVEGSTVEVKIFGSGGNVEIGDLVQPMLDGLNIAWKGSVIALVYSSVASYLLIGSYAIAKPFAVTAIIFWIIYIFVSRLDQAIPRAVLAIRKIRDFSLLICFTFLLVMPFTVFFSGKLSEATTKPLEGPVMATFSTIQEVSDISEYRTKEGFKDKAEYLFEKSNSLIRWALWDAPKDVISSSFKWFSIKLLNGIVFPLASLAFLIWMVRDILYPALGMSDRGLAAGDLKRLGDFLKGSGKGS